MKLHELKPAESSRKEHNRVGRGAAAGDGKASGHERKDQKAHSGGGVRPGFEGGQLPLFRRLPKRGFTSISHREYATVSLDQLNKFEDGAEVIPALLVESDVVKNGKSGIKVLDNDSLDKELTVKAHKFSASAAEAIDAKGGAHEVI